MSLKKKVSTLFSTFGGWCLYPLSFLCPRSKKICVLGSNHNGFNGNSKYLHIYFYENIGHVIPIWIASSRQEAESVKGKGLKAYYKWSLLGLFYCLRAKTYFIAGRLSDIHFWTSGGATVVNLWHGIGIKKQGCVATDPGSIRTFQTHRWHTQIFNPQLLKAPDYFLSTTEPLSEVVYLEAFEMEMHQMLHLGFPRSDHFFKTHSEQKKMIAKYESSEMLETVEAFDNYETIYFYLPTYRDSQTDFIKASGIDFKQLNDLMIEQNALFVFKFHPWTKMDGINCSQFSNILELNKDFDIYRLIPFTDVLITDYSSVYDDYLLLKKKVITFTFDYDKYIKDDRSFVIEYDHHYRFGARVNKFDELLGELSKTSKLNLTDEVEEHRSFVWGQYTGKSSEIIAQKFFPTT